MLNTFLLRLLKNKGYHIFSDAVFKRNYRSRSEFNPLEQLFYERLHPDFFYIQIGANDGVSFDPIFRLISEEKVRGLALEPLPDIFEKLKVNYAGQPQVTLVNKALHNEEKAMTLYRVNQALKKYPDWTKGTASFNKAHHEKSGIDPADIVEEKVSCISWGELLKSYSVQHVDLLQIDTEGYDYHIIRMIDFEQLAPSIISFEHGLRDGVMTWQQFHEIEELLVRNNYNLIVLKHDAIAYKRLDG
ncbi:MAG TPA: FkbM family methyltransferase [Lacibacter sp.]|nr:FkbM family methyltransferase [Lacibacter sp.]HMO88656.1 FkbM family methyltransferase [Lacibacter sp.]